MEKIIKINIKSALGSFKKPQSNNNHSSFNIIPKSTLIGIIGAVVGLDRNYMREFNVYKFLSENIQYSIKLNKPFIKKYWSEYGYNLANKKQSGRSLYTPDKFERIVDIDYDVCIKFNDENKDINIILNNFISNLKNEVSIFPTYMGMANFMNDISFIGEFQSELKHGEFKSKYFVTDLDMSKDIDFTNIMSEDLPTKSLDYLVYDYKSYKNIYFNDKCEDLFAVGDYYLIDDECVEFI